MHNNLSDCNYTLAERVLNSQYTKSTYEGEHKTRNIFMESVYPKYSLSA